MHTQSTATHTTTASSFRPRVRRLGPGHYLVESASRPGRGHTTTATSCSCIGFSYRHHCKHVALVQALEPSMQTWYAQATPEGPVAVPMTTPPVVASLDAQTDEAEARLASARRALQDADSRDDFYAVLWRQVDGLEREVAALHWQVMRAA